MSILRIQFLTSLIFCLMIYQALLPSSLNGQTNSNIKSLLPTANAGPDFRIYADEPILLDASKSKGLNIRAAWDFDDRDGIEEEAAGIMVRHIYKKPGAYIATVTVKDNQGRSSWDKCLVEVLTRPGDGIALVDNFEGGYIGTVLQNGNHFTCSLIKSVSWTVRIDNCADVPVSFRIYGYGDNIPVPRSITHYKDATFDENFKAMFSYGFEGHEWFRLDDAEYRYIPEDEAMEITVTFPRGPVYIGWCMTYTPYALHKYLSGLPDLPCLEVEYIGRTVEGRDIPMVTIGEPEPGIDPATIWTIGGQHAYEVAGGPISEGMINFLISDDPAALKARTNMFFKIVPLLDLDGFANKWFRYNKHGIDLNRNWDTHDNGSGHDSAIPEPEVAAVQKVIRNWISRGHKITVGMDFHDHTALVQGLLFLSKRPEPEPGTPEWEFYKTIANRYLPEPEVRHPRREASGFFGGSASFAGLAAEFPGNKIGFTLETSLGGWGPANEPAKFPATRENLKNLGERLVRMCVEYMELSNKSD